MPACWINRAQDHYGSRKDMLRLTVALSLPLDFDLDLDFVRFGCPMWYINQMPSTKVSPIMPVRLNCRIRKMLPHRLTLGAVNPNLEPSLSKVTTYSFMRALPTKMGLSSYCAFPKSKQHPSLVIRMQLRLRMVTSTPSSTNVRSGQLASQGQMLLWQSEKQSLSNWLYSLLLKQMRSVAESRIMVLAAMWEQSQRPTRIDLSRTCHISSPTFLTKWVLSSIDSGISPQQSMEGSPIGRIWRLKMDELIWCYLAALSRKLGTVEKPMPSNPAI